MTQRAPRQDSYPRFLGASGGVGGSSGSTCIQVCPDTLVDCGSGLGELSLEQMREIRHIFLTHPHMDHICYLPTFLGNLFEHAERPVTIYGLPGVLDVLQADIFNNRVWPDFTQLPDPADPLIQFAPIPPYQPINLTNGWVLQALPVSHTVETVGYSMQRDDKHYVFTADTRLHENVIARVNELGQADVLILECSFPDRKQELAVMSGHMTPADVKTFLVHLDYQPGEVWITHMKPAYEAELREVFQNDPQLRDMVLL